jgi:hypothetical protein
MKRVIRSDEPVTLFLLLWSHKCNFGAEPKSRIIATSAVKGLTNKQNKKTKKILTLVETLRPKKARHHHYTFASWLPDAG